LDKIPVIFPNILLQKKIIQKLDDILGQLEEKKKEIINIGYSYDITLSNLGTQSGGAHEFSISYAWFSGDPRKPPKNVRLIPCPNF